MTKKVKIDFAFGQSFQDEMLAIMTNDLGLAMKIVKHIPEDRLYTEGHKYLFAKIKDKVEKSGSLPTFVEIEDGMKSLEKGKRRILKRFCRKIFDLKPASNDFIKEKLTDYAKRNSFIDIFQTGQTFYNSKEFEKAYQYVMEGIGELYTINFKDDAGIPIEKFEEIRQIHVHNAVMHHTRIPTNIGPLDDILRGGLEKGELGILLAEPKRGKSIGLVHMGATALMMGFGRVAHFVLEGTTEQTTMRYQSRISQIPYWQIEKDSLAPSQQERLDGIGRKYTSRLDLIPMNKHWEYSVMDIEQKIKELTRSGRKPDLVVIDYGDLLIHHEKTRDKREEQTMVFRNLKRLAMIYNVAVWTASQARRPEEKPDKVGLLRAKDISECYEKVRIADLVATLNQTPKEKALGIMRFHIDIYRSNEADFTIKFLCDYERMIFYSKKYGHPTKYDTPSWNKD